MKRIKLFEEFNKLNEFKDGSIDFSVEYSKVNVQFPDGKIHKIKTLGQVWKDENTYGFAIGISPKDVPFVFTDGESVITLYETSDEDDTAYVEGEWDDDEVLSALNFEAVMKEITKITWTKELLEADEIDLTKILKSQKKK